MATKKIKKLTSLVQLRKDRQAQLAVGPHPGCHSFKKSEYNRRMDQQTFLQQPNPNGQDYSSLIDKPITRNPNHINDRDKILIKGSTYFIVPQA